jgi:hypothetical protein
LNHYFLIEEYVKENAGEAKAKIFQCEFFSFFYIVNQTLKISSSKIFKEGVKKLENFSIDSRSKQLCDLLYIIASYYEFLPFDPEEANGRNLDEFQDSFKYCFILTKVFSIEFRNSFSESS